jgi:hypothetical protein
VVLHFVAHDVARGQAAGVTAAPFIVDLAATTSNAECAKAAKKTLGWLTTRPLR